jgi:hypothetical protein
MPMEQVNELMALPWRDLAKQIAENANTEVNCVVSDEATFERTRTRKYLGIKVKTHVKLKWDSGEFTSSIQSPPGYEHLSRSKVVIAAPLKGKWRAGVTTGFTSKFEIWVAGTKVFSDNPSITQTLELFDVKLRAEAKLKTVEADRPRLKSAKVTGRLGLRLRGLLNVTWGPKNVTLKFVPPDRYQIKIPLDIGLGGTPVAGMPKAGFEGSVILDVQPEALAEVDLPEIGDLDLGEISFRYRIVAVKYEGSLKIRIARISIAGEKINIEASLPFSFDTGMRFMTPASWWNFLPDPTAIPKSWGENPPKKVRQPLRGLYHYDYLAAALEIEQAAMPDSALSEAATGALPLAPYHAPFGLVYEVRYAGCGERAWVRPQYEGHADCAIWTGHFLAAESFRYAAAPSDEVLARVRFILGGIEKLFQVTGVTGLFARAALPADWRIQTDPSMCEKTKTSGSKCKPGKLERTYQAMIDGRKWCGYGRGEDPITRDSYIGIMLGMTCAWKYVDDADVRSRIRKLVTDALQHLVIEHDWNVRTPAGGPSQSPAWQPILTSFIHQFVHQLALLRLGKTVNPQKFGALYDHFSGAADAAWIPVWGTAAEPIRKYYKFNLSHAALLILSLLEDKAALRAHYRFAFDILRRAVRHHRNAYFNLARVMMAAEGDRAAALAEPSGFAAEISLRSETRELLEEWLTRRDCLAGPRNLPQNRPPDPAYLRSLAGKNAPNPAVDYTAVGEKEPMGSLMTKWALPVSKRVGTDFLWQRPPFNTAMRECPKKPIVSAQNPCDVSPGIDYLLPFWMAQYVGLFEAVPDEVGTTHTTPPSRRPAPGRR